MLMNVLMDHLFFSLLLVTLTLHPLSLPAQSTESQITVEGSVYCDPCFNTRFSKYSYFMPGVDVHIQCKLKASPPGTAELITFSVNRSTDSSGVFKLEIPHVDGVDCVEGPPIQFSCQASLIGSSSAACNIPYVGKANSNHRLPERPPNPSRTWFSLKDPRTWFPRGPFQLPSPPPPPMFNPLDPRTWPPLRSPPPINIS